MRLSWSRESFGYALRDGDGLARATMVQNREGFWGQIITRNMPDSGPYKNRRDAAQWVARMMVRWELVPATSTFDQNFPVPVAAKRRAA